MEKVMRWNSDTANTLNTFLRLHKLSDTPETLKQSEEYIHMYKVKLRKELKRRYHNKETYQDGVGIVVGEYSLYGGEVTMTKLLYPNETWSKEEKEEYVRDNWKYVTAWYDCSGQTFTQRIRVFNTPKGVVVYIFETLDI